ncbi:hypothetical protein [uncultured Allofournierella sp.]|uniref:phage tail protein n=1 Tax=uncultured Allofournierella sp. TaxID=1940258 RepID=UPI003751C2D1
MADGKVVIDTRLNNDGLKKGISEIKGSLGGLKSVVGKITGTIAAAFAVQKVLQFGAACIELGSDVAEVQNVVDTAFGSMAYKMEQFADTAITQFGMSKLAAKKTGSSYMAMARGMGVAEEAASDMAIALTGLSGDVASFYNITQEQAAYKLQSVFTGETESLKELGVVMTQTNLQQYAMANGMGSNIQSMNQAQQTALRYSYVVDQLRLASGDFAKTQDSWANQTRILAMQWQEFMSIIGQALTTVLLPVVRMLNTIVSALINMANAFNAVITSIFGGAQKQVQSTSAAIESANAGISSSATDAAQSEQALADGTSAAGDAAKGATTGIDELNVLQKDTANSGSGGQGAGTTSPGGSAAGGGLAETVTQETKPMTEKMKQFVDKIKQLIEPLKAISFDNLITALGTLKDAITPLGKTLFAGLEWAWYNIFVPLAAWTAESFLPALLEMLAAAIVALNAGIEALQPMAVWLWESFLQPLASWTAGAIVETLHLFTEGLQGVSTWISENQGLVETATVIVGAFMALWKLTDIATWCINAGGVIGVIQGITEAVKASTTMKLADKLMDLQIIALYAKDFVVSAGKALAAILKNTAAWVASTAAKGANTTAQWLQIAATTAWNAICATATVLTTAFGAAVAFLTSPIGLVVVAITALIAIVVLLITHWDTVKSVAKSVWNGVVAVWGGASAWFKNVVINPVLNNFSILFSSIKRIFQGIIDFVMGIFTGDWKRAWQGIKDIFGGVWDGVTGLLKNNVNSIIGFVNGLISAVAAGINAVIGALNGINVSIPQWVPGLGGASFGFSIPTISAPQIPALARGAVLPANKPFLAMVGDQKRGTNVEAPLDTIKQALAEVLAQVGGQELTASQPIEVTLDGQVLYRAMSKIQARQGRRIGGAFADAY